MTRIGIFGWGLVAPRSPDIDTFAANLDGGDSWLSAFDGFGPSTFLVGQPEFDFERYHRWVDARFPPTKFPQLQQKMGFTTQYALAAFIQSLEQNPGIEEALQDLGPLAHVAIGTGVGDLPTRYDCSLALHRAQRSWNRFWSDPQRNADRKLFEEVDPETRDELIADWGVPPDPRDVPLEKGEREWILDEWLDFWMRRSEKLPDYLAAFEGIEEMGVEGEVGAGKLHLIRRKKAALAALNEEWGCPDPPWMAVSPNLIWNIANAPAAQVSMIGRITGPSYAPIAACSSFGVALKLAMLAIRSGEAKAVVVGMSDPPPHPLLVAAFYRARVLAADRRPSIPLSMLRGTHISGGSCVWLVGDYEYFTRMGFEPLGLEILGVGVTSDAEHIITPSKEGPRDAIRQAIDAAGADGTRFGTWDLHATATPGDYQEIQTLSDVFPNGLAVTARKGTFGHGMAASGGWELTAQYLGVVRGKLQPTPLTAEALHPEIGKAPFRYVLDTECDAPGGLAGKLSMGIGGINACVVSRRWDEVSPPSS